MFPIINTYSEKQVGSIFFVFLICKFKRYALPVKKLLGLFCVDFQNIRESFRLLPDSKAARGILTAKAVRPLYHFLSAYRTHSNTFAGAGCGIKCDFHLRLFSGQIEIQKTVIGFTRLLTHTTFIGYRLAGKQCDGVFL